MHPLMTKKKFRLDIFNGTLTTSISLKKLVKPLAWENLPYYLLDILCLNAPNLSFHSQLIY